MRVLQAILVKHVALIATKMIMNVTSPVEAPRNPAMNLASAVFILGWAGEVSVGSREFLKEYSGPKLSSPKKQKENLCKS